MDDGPIRDLPHLGRELGVTTMLVVLAHEFE
jgi:hypothetical protein